MKYNNLIKFLLILFLLFTWTLNVFAWTKTLSNSYSSESECNSKVLEYNISYPSYYRTSCFQQEESYYYNLCDNQLDCNSQSNSSTNNVGDEIVVNNILSSLSWENPYASKFSDKILEKLKIVIKKISSKKDELSWSDYNKLLKAFDNKLTKIKNKYPNSNTIQNLVGYLEFETKQLYIDTDIDDFFCELTWNCWKENIWTTIDWTVENWTTISWTTDDWTAIDSNNGKTKIFTNPKINWLNILSNFWWITWITKFCIQNWYTRATAVKTNILPLSERQTNGLYWYAWPQKLMLYYDALKNEESNWQNTFEYAKNLDKYWNYVTNVTCINDNFVNIDDSKRIDENECDSIIEYWNIKLCSTSKIAKTYEEKDSICPSGYKVPNPIEFAQIIYSNKLSFTLKSPFLKIFPKWAYWLAWKWKSWNVYLYTNKIKGWWAKEIFWWIAVQRYLKNDKYVMCYKWPNISMNKYETSTGFNFYLWWYPQWICKSLIKEYKWYNINNTNRNYLLNWEKAIFDTNDDVKIVMTCNLWKLETRTEKEFEEYQKQKLQEEQEKLEQQIIEEENKRKLEKEAKELWCEKLIKIWNISLCDTWKSVAFNELNTIYCPTWYKKPNYREAMYFKIVNKEMINSWFKPSYWTSSVYKDVTSLNSIPPRQENNRYLTSWIQDMGSYELLSWLIKYGRTLKQYNVLCYKWPSISSNYVNNCNLKPFYKYWEDTFINRMDRKILLKWEKIVLESGNWKKIEIACNWNNLNIKPLNYEISLNLNLSNSNPKTWEEITLSWEWIGVSDCKISDNIQDNIYEINPLYLHTIFNNYWKELNIQSNYKIELKPYYNTNIIIQCIDDFTWKKRIKEANISWIKSDKYIAFSSETVNYRLEYIWDDKYKVYWSTWYQNKNNYCQFIWIWNTPNSGYRMIWKLKDNPIFLNYLGEYYLDYWSTIIDVNWYNPIFPLEIWIGCWKWKDWFKISTQKLYSSIYNNTMEYDTEWYLIYDKQVNHLKWNLKGSYGRNIQIKDLSWERSLNDWASIFTTRFQSWTISFSPKKSTTIQLIWEWSNWKKFEKFIYISIYE